MAIRFTSANGNEYLTAPDGANTSFPNGDYVLAFFLRPVGSIGDALPGHYEFSTGALNDANAINCYYMGVTNNQKFDVGTTQLTTTTSHGDSTWRLYVLQRSGTTLTVRSCPILSTAPTDGSSVVAETSGTHASALDGAGFAIASRVDFTTARLLDDEMTRMFRYDGTLTDLEVARLAYGEEITDLGKTPAWYIPMSDNTDYLDAAGNLTMTKSGSPTSVSEPAWGYVPATVLQGAAAAVATATGDLSVNSIGATDLTANRIYQRISGVRDIVFSGTYSGETPTSIQVQLYAADGTTVSQAWTTLTSATISGGTWSGTLSVPQGGMYRFAARSRNAVPAVIATGGVSSNLWGVGDLIVAMGSSGAANWVDSNSGTGFTANTNVRRYNISNAWAAGGTVGAFVTLANALNDALGIPIGIVETGISGSTLANWSNDASTEFTSFETDLSAIGGKVASVSIHVGTNDAANGTVASKAAHLAQYQALTANIRTATGQASLPIFISGSNGRTSANNTAFDQIREAEMDMSAESNTYFAATTVDLEISGDNVHLTAAGYQAAIARMQLAHLDVFGSGTFHRGVKINSIVGNDNTATITVAHAGGSDITVNATHGFTASDGSGALTISSAARQSATTILLTFNRSISGTLVVKYASGARPLGTGQGVHDNTALALPLEIETELAATMAIALAGSAASVAAATGALTTGIQLSGSPASVAALTGALTTAIQLAGGAAAEATAAADLTITPSGLAGNLQCVATATGLLTDLLLAGNAQSESVATGDLTTAIQLAGAAESVATVAGQLTEPSTPISGDAMAVATATGNLTTTPAPFVRLTKRNVSGVLTKREFNYV